MTRTAVDMVDDRELTCPHCGGVVPVPVPDQPIGRELAQRLADSGRADVAASAVLGSFLPAEPAQYVYPPVEFYARNRRRTNTRGLEKTYLSSEARFKSMDEKRRDQMLDRTFPIGDGVEVPWRTATVAQHAKRIELLEVNQKGIDRTIARHRLAMSMIEGTPGAQCLDDVPGAEERLGPDASGEVVTVGRSTARKPVTGGNARSQPAEAAKASTKGNAGRNRSR